MRSDSDAPHLINGRTTSMLDDPTRFAASSRAASFADVRGAVERDFGTQCTLCAKALADPGHTYTYAFQLKEVLADRDMAVVRLTWTTTARVKTTGAVEMTEDEGLDVFGRGTDGNWLIVRYMAYERP